MTEIRNQTFDEVTAERPTVGWVNQLAMALKLGVDHQPTLDQMTNDQLNDTTDLVDRMFRAVHIEKQKIKREAPS